MGFVRAPTSKKSQDALGPFCFSDTRPAQLVVAELGREILHSLTRGIHDV